MLVCHVLWVCMKWRMCMTVLYLTQLYEKMCDACDFTLGFSIFVMGRICSAGLRIQGQGYSVPTISRTGRIGFGQQATVILSQGFIAADYIWNHTLSNRMLVKISCLQVHWCGQARPRNRPTCVYNVPAPACRTP